jgi:hypothetical protein
MNIKSIKGVRRMGNQLQNAFSGLIGYRSMMIERIIAADPHEIYIGISEGEQVIRVDRGDLKKLISFHDRIGKLHYEFEGNILLEFMKSENGEIQYRLQVPPFEVIQMMNPVVQKHWKNIEFKSDEFDKIGAFINPSNQ